MGRFSESADALYGQGGGADPSVETAPEEVKPGRFSASADALYGGGGGEQDPFSISARKSRLNKYVAWKSANKDVTPEQASSVFHMSQALNKDPDVIFADLNGYKRKVQAGEIEAHMMDAPMMKKLLENPKTSGMVVDDTANLSGIEKTIGVLGAKLGWKMVELGPYTLTSTLEAARLKISAEDFPGAAAFVQERRKEPIFRAMMNGAVGDLLGGMTGGQVDSVIDSLLSGERGLSISDPAAPVNNAVTAAMTVMEGLHENRLYGGIVTDFVNKSLKTGLDHDQVGAIISAVKETGESGRANLLIAEFLHGQVNRSYGEEGWIERWITSAPAFVAEMMFDHAGQAAGAALGGLFSGVGGAAGGTAAAPGPGTAVGGILGVGGGAIGGGYLGGMVGDVYQSAGPTFMMLRQMRDDDGDPLLTDNEAREIAWAAAIIQSTVTAIPGGKVAKKIPIIGGVIESVGERFTKTAVKSTTKKLRKQGLNEITEESLEKFAKAAVDPLSPFAKGMTEGQVQKRLVDLLSKESVKGILTDTARAWGSGLAWSSADYMGQGLVQGGAVEYARASKGLDWSMEAVWDSGVNTALEALKDGALVMGFRPGRVALERMSSLGATRQHQTHLAKIMNAAEQSKLRERAPQVFEQFAKDITRNIDGVDSVFVDRGLWDAAWAGAQIDPRAAAETVLGDTKAYDQSAITGGRIEVPLHAYISKLAGSQVEKTLREGATLDPGVPTMQDLLEYHEKGQALVEASRADKDALIQRVYQAAYDKMDASATNLRGTKEGAIKVETAADAFSRMVGNLLDAYEATERPEIAERLGAIVEDLGIHGPQSEKVAADLKEQAKARKARKRVYERSEDAQHMAELARMGMTNAMELAALKDKAQKRQVALIKARKQGPGQAAKVKRLEETLAEIDAQHRKLSGVSVHEAKKVVGEQPAQEGTVVPRVKKREQGLEQPAIPLAEGGDVSLEQPRWFSRVEEAVGEAKQKKGDAKSWLAVLSKTPGVKAEEIEWMGLKEWLGDRKGITREEVAEYVAAHRIEVKEVVEGDPTPPAITEERHNEIVAELTDLRKITDDFSGKRTPEEQDAARRRVGLLEDELVGAAGQDGDGHIYPEYTIAGTDDPNLRAIVFLHPEGTPASKDWQGLGAHPGGTKPVLAHARYTTTTLADGREALLVEEIQSDWAQEGRKKGFADREAKSREKAYKDATDAHSRFQQKMREKYDTLAIWGEVTEEERAELVRLNQVALEAQESTALVPDAPFKTTWEEMVVKRLISLAVEKGLDTIAWTTGETQAERYKKQLQQVSEIRWNPETGSLAALPSSADQSRYLVHENDDGTFSVVDSGLAVAVDGPFATPEEANAAVAERGGTDWSGAIKQENVSKSKLADLIGKDAARALIESEESDGWKSLKTENVKIGGAGMRASYDTRIPSIFKKLLKKHGGKVGMGGVSAGGREDVRIIDHGGRFTIYDPVEGGEYDGEYSTRKDAQARADEINAPTKADTAVHTADIPTALHDIVKAKGMALFQGPRGKLTWTGERGEKRQFDILLFEDHDVSTLTHELFHFFSEILADLAVSPTAPAQITKQYDEMAKVMGYESGEARSAKLVTEYEERGAFAFESFLADGKAPTAELQGTFEAYRKWMLGIYSKVIEQGEPRVRANLDERFKQAYNTDLDIPPQTADLFNRLLAGEEAVEREAQEIGLQADPNLVAIMEEVKRGSGRQHEADVEAAKSEGTTRLLKLAELEARRSGLKQEVEEITEDVEKQMDGEKVWAAIHHLRTGEEKEGGPDFPRPGILTSGVGIRRDVLLKAVGKDVVSRMGGVFSNKRGAPDRATSEAVAYHLGYDSLAEMAHAIANAGKRKDEVGRRVQAEVENRYRDVLTDPEGYAAKAAEALGPKEIAVLLDQLNVLRTVRKVQKVSYSELNLMVEGIVDEMTIAQLQPGRFRQAAERAGRRALLATERGDYEAAEQAKAEQVIERLKFRKAIIAKGKTDVAKRVALKTKATSWQAALGKADQSPDGRLRLQEANNAILQAVGIVSWEGVRVDGEPPLFSGFQAVLAEIQASADVFDHAVIEGIIRDQKKWRTLTTFEAETVKAAIRNIRATANLMNTVMTEQGAEDFKSAVDSMVATAEKNVRKSGPRHRDDVLKTLREKAAGGLEQYQAMFTSTEILVDILDAEDADGPWHRFIFDGFIESRNRRERYAEAFAKPIIDHMEKEMTREQRKALLKPANTLSESGRQLLPLTEAELAEHPQEMTVKSLLVIALNLGSGQRIQRKDGTWEWTGNVQRLLDGRKWNLEDVMTALGQNLTKEMAETINKVWASLEGMYPLIAQQHLDENGVAMGKVNARAFTLNIDGEEVKMTGGYFPIVYDPKYGGTAAEKQEADPMQRSAASRPQVDSRMTKGRARKVERALSLDWGEVPRAIDRHLQYIAYRRWVMDAHKIVNDDKVRQALRTHMGEDFDKALMGFVKDVAGGGENPVAWEQSRTGRVIGSMGGVFSAAVLGFSAPVALGDYATVWGAAMDYGTDLMGGKAKRHWYIGRAHYDIIVKPGLKGLGFGEGDVPVGLKYAHSLSEELRYRKDRKATKYTEILKRMGIDKKMGAYYDFAFYLLEKSDMLSSGTIWTAAHYAALDQGYSKEEAISRADRIVRRVQPKMGSEVIPFLRKGNSWKALVPFYGYMANVADRMHLIRSRVTRPGMSKKSRAKAIAVAAAALGATYIVEIMGGEWSSFHGPEDMDEDELWKVFAKWGAGQAASAPVRFAPAIGRDAENVLKDVATDTTSRRFDRTSPFYSVINMFFRQFGMTMKAWKDGGFDDEFIISAIKTAGVFAPRRPQRSIDYAVQLAQGEADGSDNYAYIISGLIGGAPRKGEFAGRDPFATVGTLYEEATGESP